MGPPQRGQVSAVQHEVALLRLWHVFSKVRSQEHLVCRFVSCVGRPASPSGWKGGRQGMRMEPAPLTAASARIPGSSLWIGTIKLSRLSSF